ncbi:MAG: hypothetical protein ACLP1D_26770 [Xanthobacteraceae bacterium]
MTVQERKRQLTDLIAQASLILRKMETSPTEIDEPSPVTSTPLLHKGEPAKTWPQSTTDWPRLKADRVARVSHVFDGEAFQSKFRPGETRLVYRAACVGLRRIAMSIRVPIFKIGTCTAGGLNNRIRELRLEPYAAAWHDTGGYRVDDDFAEWFPSLLKTRLTPLPHSPVRLAERAYVVTLPVDMTADEFEAELQKVLLPAQLFKWLESAEGMRHCAALGVAPEIGRRSTVYNRGDVSKLCPATEIYVFRAQSDPDRLLAALESIIIEKVLGAKGS